MSPGGPGYRRMSLALFLAGVATFALLYSTQALLPLVSSDLAVSASDASWTATLNISYPIGTASTSATPGT